MDERLRSFICPYELFGEKHYPTIKARSADEAQGILRNIVPTALLHRPYERKTFKEHTAEAVDDLIERMR